MWFDPQWVLVVCVGYNADQYDLFLQSQSCTIALIDAHDNRRRFEHVRPSQ